MKTQRFFLNRLVHAFSISLLIGVFGISPVEAKDTDVYLMSPQVARDDSPNVLVIFDNSGSMSTNIGSTRPAFDPTVDYCNDAALEAIAVGASATKPSPCATSGRTYWSFGSSPTPPGTGTSRWFDNSKNKCFASATPLGSSGSGVYGGTKIARFNDTGDRNWRSLSGYSDGDIKYVDCQADGNTNGELTGDNKFPRDNVTNAYTTSSAQAFNWGSFTSSATPTLYNANYVNYWNNSGLGVTLTRLQVAKDAVKSLIDSNTAVRFGLLAFNDNNTTPHGGRVLMRIETMDNTRRTAMKNVVDGLTAITYTPLAEALWEGRRYYGGLAVDYGNPSPDQSPNQDSCAQNVTSSYCSNGGMYRATSGEYSCPAGAPSGDPCYNRSGDILSGAPVDTSYNTGTYISPFKYGCQTAYVIYVTDGDPTNDSNADGSTRITGLSGLGSCDGSSCLDDLAGWMHDNDVYGGLSGKQSVVTYTIGFGGGISTAGLALLNQTATKGGGAYYTADNSDQLASALQGAITAILSANTSFTAPSLSVNAFNKLYNRDDVYFALFKPLSSVGWDGNVKRFRLCNTADVTAYGCTFGEVIDVNNAPAVDNLTSKIKSTAVSYWGSTADGPEVTKGGAGAKITDNTKVPRTLYTYRGTYSGLSNAAPATPVTVVATSGNTVYDAAVTDPTIIGLPAGSTSTDVATLINWMRGQDAYDKDADTSTTEARAWNFTDPLHSRPVAVTFGCVGTGACTTSSDPIIKLVVGTNDGMVRIINNSTGLEEWAFMPKEMLSTQYSLAQNADGDHVVGMDDSPAFLTTDINNDGIIDPAAGDRVYMYIGMRRGGRNLYAFDITPAAKMTAQTDTVTPKLMWVIEGGAGSYTKLGQTWSRPRVVRVRAKCTATACNDIDPFTDDSESRMVLIMGGGYDTNQDNGMPPPSDTMGNAIYVINPFDGSRIWWASSDSTANLVLSGMRFSIPSEITTLDTNGDKSVDRLYVGDTGGQIWRIDLGDQLGATGTGGSSGYKFADVGCDSTSSTARVHDASGVCPVASTKQGLRKFFYPPDVAQVKDAAYSTVENYDLVAIGSGNREDPLDLLTSITPAVEAVHNRIYAFRDYNYKAGAPTTTPTAITDTDMYDATANNLGTLSGTALTTEIDTNVKNSKGWFFDLMEPSAVTLTYGITSKFVGEKVLAKPLIYNGVLFFTTFIPANDSTALTTCQANEGLGRFYEVNYLTGTAAYDLDNNGSLDRFGIAGGGIPSEVIIVIRDGGVTGLVGTSGGAKQVVPGGGTNRYKTFWWDE